VVTYRQARVFGIGSPPRLAGRRVAVNWIEAPRTTVEALARRETVASTGAAVTENPPEYIPSLPGIFPAHVAVVLFPMYT